MIAALVGFAAGVFLTVAIVGTLYAIQAGMLEEINRQHAQLKRRVDELADRLEERERLLSEVKP